MRACVLGWVHAYAHLYSILFTLPLCYRAKDVRNKEFFEKHFPEIKRHTLRLGPKGFSVVRSEAELNEILDELYEQEEVCYLCVISLCEYFTHTLYLAEHWTFTCPYVHAHIQSLSY